MQIIVQIVLVLAVVIVSLALMRGGSNARHLAIRRIMLIVSFLVFMATTYQRFRHMETTMTKLSRRIALDETNQTQSPAVAARVIEAGTDYSRHSQTDAGAE